MGHWSSSDRQLTLTDYQWILYNSVRPVFPRKTEKVERYMWEEEEEEGVAMPQKPVLGTRCQDTHYQHCFFSLDRWQIVVLFAQASIYTELNGKWTAFI